MRILRQKLSKISAKIDTFPIFEEKSHSRDNTNILHPFFRYLDIGICLEIHPKMIDSLDMK